MSWSLERIKRPRNVGRFDSKQVRAEAREAAREYALQTKGPSHKSKVQKVLRQAKERRQKKNYLARVQRGLRLQDREITARRWLVARGATTGSDFSPAERSELRRWFDALDTDGGGDIDLAELAAPLLSTGIASSIPEVRAIIEKNQIEEGGGIDFESFQRLLKRGVHGGGASSSSDHGLAALQQLRTHVEAAQSNLGINLDSRINQTRRAILMKELQAIRHSSGGDNDGLGSPGSGKTSERSSPCQQQRRRGAHHGNIHADISKALKLLEVKKKKKMKKRRELAIKKQRKEDKMLALWRVVLGSKDSDKAGFHLGQLPPVIVDRGKVYKDWKELQPKMHADSDVRKSEWERVGHWMRRSCDPNDQQRPVVVLAESDDDSGGSSSSSSSSSVMKTSQSAPALARQEKETSQLERMLSSYLRPTRADVFAARSRKKRQREMRKRDVSTIAAVIHSKSGALKELEPRQFPPFSIILQNGSVERSEVTVGSVGARRRQRQEGLLVESF